MIMLMSHPTWVCGLKQGQEPIEIYHPSHTLRGCVDWNFLLLMLIIVTLVTPYVGVWIETDFQVARGGASCHTLRGCVDWNCPEHNVAIIVVVTPYVGVWIETWIKGK